MTNLSNAALKEPDQADSSVYVASFEDLRMTDVESVGGKNASLGEMISQLAARRRARAGRLRHHGRRPSATSSITASTAAHRWATASRPAWKA